MKIKVFSSGSKGNSSIVITENTKVLIDIGINYLTLTKHLEKNNININEINGVLITHNHKDHISGLKTLINKTHMKVYIPEEMYDSIKSQIDLYDCIFLKEQDKINDLNINLIRTSHDAPYSVGFILENNNKSIVYITDTGYINRKYIKELSNRDCYIIESNHDPEMLMNGPYPRFLKQRVVSDSGHLSNEQCANYLKQFIGKNTKYIYLAHLSETNNTPEIAINTNKQIINKDILINICYQDKETEFIEV